MLMGMLVCCLIVTSFCGGNSAFAADLDDRQDALAGQLEHLTASINRLSEIYEKSRSQAEQDALYRKLDIAVAYLNFRSRRIEMLEQGLQELHTSRSRMETFILQLNEKTNLMEAQARTSAIGSSVALEQQRAEQELRSKMMQERLERTDREIVIIENKIEELQMEISSVESFVQKNLEF